MKKFKNIARLALSLIVTLTLIMTLSVPCFAAIKVEYSTNGAAGKYGPGSELVFWGKATDDGVVLKNMNITVDVKVGDKSLHYTNLTTDSNGLFNTRISIPKNAGQGAKLKVEVLVETKKPITSYEKTLGEAGSLEFLGFVGPAGYREGESATKIPAGTSTLGFAFESNVNYYNNKDRQLGLESLGYNERNKDCFTLYKKDSSGSYIYVGSNVSLVKSEKQGDEIIPSSKITLLPGKTIGGDGMQGTNLSRKDVIYLTPNSPLEAGGEYKVVIDGRLSANHSGTMGADETVYFSVSGSTGNAGAGGGGTAPVEKDTSVESKTEISGGKGETKITDAQITEALKNTSNEGNNNLVFEVKSTDISGKGVSELSLTLTGEQTKQLAGKADNIVYATPLGDVKLPVTALEGASGNVALTVAEDKDTPDTYIVTLTDSKGKITSFKDAVTLKFTAKDKNAGYNALSHNGKIMKNAKVNNGEAKGKTKGFSSFAFTKNQKTFADIQTHWAKGNIESLAARNILDGKAENVFDPNANVTRAEFIKMIVNSVDNLEVKPTGATSFSDIPKGQWFSDCVLWAAENKIVNGTGNGAFGPNQNITRQDMCVIIEKASDVLGITLYDEKSQTLFADDKDIADYAKNSVYKMQKSGMIAGKGNNCFEPKAGATRAEASKIIDMLIDKLISQ